MGKLIIDGNKVYEIDEEWEQKWERNRKEKNSREKNRKGTRGISRNNFL